jgi:Tfp pilus assembly protein PilX
MPVVNGAQLLRIIQKFLHANRKIGYTMHKQEGEMISIKNNQEGLVSVTVTLIIMIVVTMIVSSFALVVRREQQRALDKQLSTQAFHAAEAGVADAVAAISAESNRLNTNVTECSGLNSFEQQLADRGLTYSSQVSSNINYSCVLIGQTPTSWNSTSVRPGESVTLPIDVGASIDAVRISWQNQDNSPSAVTSFDRPQGTSGALDAPMLRVTVFPDIAGRTRNELKQSAHTMFLSPAMNSNPGAAGTINYGISGQTDPKQGMFVAGQCNVGNRDNSSVSAKPAKFECNVDINTGGGNKYYVVIQPLYKTAMIDLSAFSGGLSTPTSLNGSQAEIDVTGKAADVLRRIRVRVDIGETASLNQNSGVSASVSSKIFPDSAISTKEGICKLWEWHPAVPSSPFSASNAGCTTP